MLTDQLWGGTLNTLSLDAVPQPVDPVPRQGRTTGGRGVSPLPAHQTTHTSVTQRPREFAVWSTVSDLLE